jgi:hypothetical protein
MEMMNVRDDPFEGLEGDRSHRHRFFQGLSEGAPLRVKERLEPSGKVHMLLEDLRLHALPYGRGSEDGFRLAVEPTNARVEELITAAIPATYYHHNRLSEAVREYVQNALWYLAQGKLYLEIEYFRPAGSPTEAPVAFRLELLRPDFVQNRLGKYRYWSPSAESNEEEVHWAREKLVPEALIVVTLPRRLRHELDRAIRIISAADQDLAVMHEFTIGKYAKNSAFSLNSYQRLSNDIVLRETHAIGWDGRGLFTEGMLDPMKIWRAIQFARLEAKLRDVALQGLQSAIDRAGKTIGFRAALRLSGVLTESDLDRLEADLEAGSRPLAEMFVPKVPN